MTIKISITATQTGFGSDDGHKRVTFLQPDERDHARAGGIVIYDCGRKAGGTHGTTWRRAVPMGSVFIPRVWTGIVPA